MRKGLLIGVGTLGGLGAVLSITPPHFTNSDLAGTGSIPANTPVPAATPTPEQTQAAAPTPTATKKTTTKKTTTKKSTATKSAAAKATTQTQSTPTPAPAQTQASTSASVNGTFSGNSFQNRFGPVQVQITVVNGKITAAKALQYPNGDFRSAEISKQAIPYLIQETLQAQSANIQGVGGASYTSYGWYQSLQSAIAKAGLK
jgi:uncharacterized protein with FMN-binding domain